MSHSQLGATTILIISFISSIILLIALSSAVIVMTEIKMSREITDSIPAFYAADSGAERCLYQVRCSQLGASATDACKAETGNGLNQGCAQKNNGSISSATESVPLLSGQESYLVDRSGEQLWTDGVLGSTKRSLELNWAETMP